ncbi:hypothetical protein HY086_07025 [Candidatus Gottesmanbacteria bacterium]|nr:hypothetical protein [Candidatus Gottesmanbacteria bacterium]
MPDPTPTAIEYRLLNPPDRDHYLKRQWHIDTLIKLGGVKGTTVSPCHEIGKPTITGVAKTFGLGEADRYRSEVEAFERANLADVPHLVKVLDNGYDPRGGNAARPMLVEEYARGEELSKILRKDPASVSSAEKIIILWKYLETLTAQQNAGLVETDPKLENVFYDPSDFSITVVDLAQCVVFPSKEVAKQEATQSLFRRNARVWQSEKPKWLKQPIAPIAGFITTLYDGPDVDSRVYGAMLEKGSLDRKNIKTSIPLHMEKALVDVAQERIGGIDELIKAIQKYSKDR